MHPLTATGVAAIRTSIATAEADNRDPADGCCAARRHGENDAGRTLAVKSKATCQGGFPGVYDLVGNVWEWFDGPCPPPDGGTDGGDGGPAKQQCIVKGGGFPNSGANLDCRVDGLGASRDTRATEIGFRCCAD